MATSTITIISGASSITLDNTVSTLTLGTSGPAGIGVPSGGTTGQLLAKNSATNYDTEWIDNFTTDVRVTVKNDSGSTLAKGTVVYVSGANGTNILVKPAIATSDATSATTIGFLLQELAANATGDVITQGTITGLNTSAGTAGDPVWLSPTVAGGVVYGVANKPQAPNHLYSLGVLTRSNAVNGEIQVFVNNGWELEELHNVKITSPANNQVLAYDSAQSLWVNSSNAALLNTANAFTVGGHTITNTVAATIPLLVKGAASQSAKYFDVQNSSSSSIWSVAPTLFESTINTKITNAALSVGTLSPYTGSAMIAANAINATSVGILIRGAASQTANLQEWQSSASTILARVDPTGIMFGVSFSTLNAYFRAAESNSGGLITMTRATAAAANPGANIGRLYFRDGTTAGTLKLVVRAGAAGAETTVLDNIPQ